MGRSCLQLTYKFIRDTLIVMSGVTQSGLYVVSDTMLTVTFHSWCGGAWGRGYWCCSLHDVLIGVVRKAYQRMANKHTWLLSAYFLMSAHFLVVSRSCNRCIYTCMIIYQRMVNKHTWLLSAYFLMSTPFLVVSRSCNRCIQA